MSGPGQPEQGSEPVSQSVEAALGSVRLAEAVESGQFNRFLDHLPIAIAVSKLAAGEQRVNYANQAFEALSGQHFSEIDGQDWSFLDAYVGEDDSQNQLGNAVLDGGDFLGIFRRERADASPILVQAYSSIIENEDGSENYRIVALVDVSERARSQREEFERQIRYKDLLLQEIQHRVKNNLQLIIGLIRIEAREVRRGEPVDIDRLAGRIECLRSLYETISAPAANVVDLGHHLSQIASTIIHAHGNDEIRLSLKVDLCPVSINIAMPAGLAVNELLTNILKYAFEGRSGGTITVECLSEDDRYRILVADDGVGLPPNTVWPRPGTLGSLIVESLRENADLKMKVESTAGRGTRIFLSIAPKISGGKPH